MQTWDLYFETIQLHLKANARPKSMAIFICHMKTEFEKKSDQKVDKSDK